MGGDYCFVILVFGGRLGFTCFSCFVFEEGLFFSDEVDSYLVRFRIGVLDIFYVFLRRWRFEGDKNLVWWFWGIGG